MHEQDTKLADIVTSTCLKSFSNLPKNGKPAEGKEWTVLAGIVEENTSKKTFQTVALGSGTKCIGPSKMRCDGKVVHDSHAEVVARRAFRRYVYNHLKIVYIGQKSHVLTVTDTVTRECSFQEHIQYHFYISHTPCGDASIIPIEECAGMSKEDKFVLTDGVSRKRKPGSSSIEDESKKPRVEAWCVSDVLRTGGKPVKGEKEDPKSAQGGYHLPGSLRNKPGRGEATVSMSCSDKIAKWNITGCLGALLSHFVPKPLYFTSLVIGKCPYSEQCMKRAVCDRISLITLNEPYKVHLPKLLHSELPFMYANEIGKSPCGSSVVWTKLPKKSLEALANGYKLGATRKQIESSTAYSSISKFSLFKEFKEVEHIQKSNRCSELSGPAVTYREYKDSAKPYQAAWRELRHVAFVNWVSHDHDLDRFFISG